MVQIKLKFFLFCIPISLLYIPYGSDKTDAVLAPSPNLNSFISHMVQIKRYVIAQTSASILSFISHMVQIKPR